MNLLVNKSLLAGLLLITLVASLTLISYLYLPCDPNQMDIGSRLELPSWRHLLGTDHFGRDILSRIMVGGRVVFLISVLSVILGALLGTVLGAVAALQKGLLASLIMRLVDGLLAFPGILLAMMLVAILGKGIANVLLAIAVFIVPVFTRLVYGLVLENENSLFLKAARSYGAGEFYLFSRHLLPVILPRIITQLSSSIGFAILVSSSLSFLGLGVQPPYASWGLMLSEARQFIMSYPYLPVMPGIIIIISVLGFNLLGDGLNDCFVKKGSVSR